jgi:hypothetical protein
MVPVLYTTRSNMDNFEGQTIHMCTTAGCDDTDDQVCATFSTIAWSGGKIVIKEGSGAVVGTGAVVSGSAKTFLEYLQTQSIAGTVLELGSGTGAVGIGVAVQGCSVVATDVVTNPHGCPIRALEAAAQDVRSEEIKHATGSFANLLEVIERNATMNNESIQRAGGNFRVSPLLWGDTDPDGRYSWS